MTTRIPKRVREEAALPSEARARLEYHRRVLDALHMVKNNFDFPGHAEEQLDKAVEIMEEVIARAEAKVEQARAEVRKP